MSQVPGHGPFVFQIGFNRCATGAFFKLFNNSGVPSLHHCGRKHRKAGDVTLLNVNPQKVIDRNLRKGRPPVEGLEKYRAFFDMEYTDLRRRIENYRYFRSFAAAYPDALFIMNTRNKDAWLKSRIAHNDGKYLQKTCELYGMTREEVLDHWSRHYDVHTTEVAEFFGGDSDRCLWFDIDRDGVDKALDFFRPHYALDEKRWKKVHETDWQGIVGTYAASLHRSFAAQETRGAPMRAGSQRPLHEARAERAAPVMTPSE